ncbi:hypothetical protein C0Q70_16866 [Pomacea canaliculata]|uniref:Uncharacterized protein n=1 Tax=Pomacea canaliculata TaxID=400727 RepID=A0A2T7NQZ2_POMCA|nr:hypothetical protein C0Q70_16866 [Pomacea canaliculata]
MNIAIQRLISIRLSSLYKLDLMVPPNSESRPAMGCSSSKHLTTSSSGKKKQPRHKQLQEDMSSQGVTSSTWVEQSSLKTGVGAISISAPERGSGDCDVTLPSPTSADSVDVQLACAPSGGGSSCEETLAMSGGGGLDAPLLLAS